jgi:tetratricopeptide (TPR) repeat protein
MLGRYYDLLDQEPENTWALGKLLKCTSVKALIARYERLAKASPQGYNHRVNLGLLHAGQKLHDQAVGYYLQAIALKPTVHVAHYYLAESYRKLQKTDEAEKAYEKALSLVTADRLKKDILRKLIDLTMVSKAMEKSRKYFKALLALEPRNRDLRVEFAQMLTRNLMYAEALVEYEALIKSFAGDSVRSAQLCKALGEVYERMGKDAEAKQAYERAMRFTVAGHGLREELTKKIIAIFRRKHDLRSLLTEYERAWKAKGFFEWTMLATLYDELGEDEKAISAYRTALRMNAQAVEWRSKLIALLNRLNRRKEAIQELERQVQVLPDEPQYQLELAGWLWTERETRRALALAAAMGRRFASDPSLHKSLSELYAAWGKPELALKELQLLVKLEPQDPQHHIDLGEQYWQRGDKARALATWRRLLAPGMYKTKDEGLAALAGVLAEHDQSQEALPLWKSAIRLNPKQVEYHRGLALTLQKGRSYDEAVTAWQKVIELCTDESQEGLRREARTAIIELWHRRGVLAAQLQQYRVRFEGRPPDLAAGYFMGEAYLKLKQGRDAERVYERILQVDPAQVDALVALETIYRESYRLRKAIEILLRLVKVVPKKAREYHDRIALLYLQLYKDSEAIAHAKAALELSRNDASGWAKLGAIYEKKEDWAAAVDAYQKAIKINSRLWKIHFALARIHLQLGQPAAAVRLYHEVVARSPDEEFVRQAARKALDIDEYLGALLDLERELIPGAFTFTAKTVYRKSLVLVYARLVPRLAFEARHDRDPKVRKRARDQLREIGQRALKPLLEALADKEGGQRDIAVDTLGHLGNPNAAPPLVRLALEPPADDEATIVAPATPGRPPTPTPPPGAPPKLSPARIALMVRALVAAGQLEDPRTAPDLAKLLTHDAVEIREAAAWALSRLRDPKVLPTLIKALDDRKVGVEVFACLGLGRQAKPPVPLMLAVVGSEERRPEVRAACAYALGLTQDRRALPLLVTLLEDERPEIQRKAAWALGLLGDASLLPRLARDVWVQRGELQQALAFAVARLAVSGALPGSDDVAVRLQDGRLDWADFLRQLRPARVPLDAARLAAILSAGARPLAAGLESALGRHRDVVLRVLETLDRHPQQLSLEIFGALEPSPGPADEALRRALAPLTDVLRGRLAALARHADRDVRAHALRLAAKLEHREGLALIRQGFADREALVRRAAGEAAVIAATRQPATRAGLVQAVAAGLDRAPWFEQVERMDVLGLLRAPEAVAILRPHLRSTQGFLVEAAVRALGRAGDPKVVPDLIVTLGHPAARIRIAAIQALLALDRMAARAALARLAGTDPSPEVRAAAAAGIR